MKYYFVSPFSSKNNGISNYIESACALLQEYGIESKIIKNDEGLNPSDLEKKIKEIATENDIVELPDAWGLFQDHESTNFQRHVRLHAPSKHLQQLNKKPINSKRYEREIKSAKNADFISSPSTNNYEAYNSSFNNINIFPNPIPLKHQETQEKNIDVIFIGRPDLIKGFDYLSKILSHLPQDISVTIVGIEKNEFEGSEFNTSKCKVNYAGWVDNTKKIDLLKRAKVCIIPSRFESFSLVASEAIACSCHVISWNVGGFSECYPKSLLTLIEQEDIISFSGAILDKLSHPLPSENIINEFIKKNNNAFISGIKSILENKTPFIFQGESNNNYTATETSIKNSYKNAVENHLHKKLDIFGFSMMNEHSQEMWGCLTNTVINKYHFVSRKELNYNSKFSRKFPINSENYTSYDWRFDTERLLAEFVKFSPQMLFVFNGNTSYFEHAVNKIHKTRSVPTVYSELGWLPQDGHIYFDSQGANYKSSIRNKRLETLTHIYDINNELSSINSFSNTVILALQLPGDTTLSPDSYPLQIQHQDLIAHVRKSLPDNIHLKIRKHPRDTEHYSLSKFDNISFDDCDNLSESLKNSLAIIAVNSTVILEAMKYPVNIYSMGYGLFQNKGIVIECHDGDIKSRWSNNINISLERRRIFLDYLSKRQLPVSKIYDSRDCSGCEVSLYPLVEALLNPPIAIETKEKMQVSINNKTNTISNSASSITVKKLHKLFKSPKHFTQDMILKKPNRYRRILTLSPKINNWLFSSSVRQLISKRKFGTDLDVAYKKIKPIERHIPLVAYLYYRTKWIYFGVTKDAIKFAKK